MQVRGLTGGAFRTSFFEHFWECDEVNKQWVAMFPNGYIKLHEEKYVKGERVLEWDWLNDTVILQ